MGLNVLRIRVVDVVGGHQGDFKLFAHAQQRLIHSLLIRNPVILQLQKIIAFSKDLFIFQGLLLGLIVETLYNISLHLPGQAGAQSDDPFVEFLQHLHIHPGPVIKPST